MRTKLANDKLDAIIKMVEKEGVQAPKLIDELKALRVNALEEKDPLVVKVLRLMYEYLGENESFGVEGQFEEDEEGNEYPLEIEEKENLLYLLSLLKNAEQKVNREELKDYRDAMKTELY
ncbi:MAG: hypothetical protein K9I25_03100 [Crocinitomicaceae bacterium]|jgi:hypothetical protein|nr:hypothetical protein [Crocinitomicaceae bacterium]